MPDVKPKDAAGFQVRAGDGVRHGALDGGAVALLVALCIFLAVGQIAIKVANTGLSPVFQAGLRSAVAAVLLGLLARLRGTVLFARDGIMAPAFLVGVLFAAEFGLLYPALSLTTASHAVILLYTSPFVVAVGAHLLIPGDRLTLSKVAGMVLAFSGVAAIVLGRSPAGGVVSGVGGEPSLVGDLMCLGAALAWGLLTLTIRTTALARVAAERVTFLQMLISTPILLALSVALGEAGVVALTPLVMGAFAFTVVFVAFITFTATNWLLTRYSASRVMAFMMMTPAFGVVAAHLLLGEALGITLVAGLALVLAGLVLVNRPVRQA